MKILEGDGFQTVSAILNRVRSWFEERQPSSFVLESIAEEVLPTEGIGEATPPCKATVDLSNDEMLRALMS